MLRPSLFAVATLIFAAPLLAQAPLTTAFTYQGELSQSGSPATGTYDLQFALFDSLGNPIGVAQCADNVAVTAGHFTVALDFGAQFQGLQRFLEIRVRADTGLNCGNLAGFTTLTPRQQLTATPYALRALSAASADTATLATNATTAANATQLGGQSAAFFQSASNINAGTLASARLSGGYTSVLTLSNPGNAFTGNGAGLTNVNAATLNGLNSSAFLTSVPNPLTLSGTNNSYIIAGLNASVVNGAAGLAGTATAASGQVYGVQGVSASTSGFGVFGAATSASGNAHGGYFESASTDGIGVVGQAKATTGGAYGVYGQSVSSSGRGVYGIASAASGVTYGGQFQSQSLSGRGVYGLASAATGPNFGVVGESASTSGRGVYGYAGAASGSTLGGLFETASSGTDATGVYGLASALSGTTYGVWGKSNSISGIGVFGINDRSSGTTYGVYGKSSSTDGRGVFGLADAVSGVTYGGSFQTNSSATGSAGVYGLANAGVGYVYGVWGQCKSAEGIAVLGICDSSSVLTTYGVYGQISSKNGAGVYGLADAATDAGATIGGSFESKSNGNNATGAYGFASANSGITYGVFGKNNSTSGYGVIGINDRTSGTTYGVYGRSASPSGWGVFAQGNSGATGTKSFRIDHPDDPENKYLQHYSSESPEVINFYSGNATLDANGEAVVELPHYFAKINKDPRYTLTAVGAPMPLLHVAKEIDEAALSAGAKAEPGEAAQQCVFLIAGGAPGAKVSWRVEAVRNDRWAQQRGAPVEIEKQGLERGTYQQPDLYGQPLEKSMNYIAARPQSEPIKTKPVGVPKVP